VAAPGITKAQKRVLLILLQADPSPVQVKDLAVVGTPGTTWTVVKRLRDAKPKALVKTGAAGGALAGGDYSTVPVSLTIAGRGVAADLQ
jgi:hypothetical protein